MSFAANWKMPFYNSLCSRQFSLNYFEIFPYFSKILLSIIRKVLAFCKICRNLFVDKIKLYGTSVLVLPSLFPILFLHSSLILVIILIFYNYNYFYYVVIIIMELFLFYAKMMPCDGAVLMVFIIIILLTQS